MFEMLKEKLLPLKPMWERALKNHFTYTLVVISFLLIAIGLYWHEKSWGESVFSLGTIIVGAGIFGGIMKTAFFSDLFKNHIADVFYDPARISDKNIAISRWRALTESLLKSVLPKQFSDAVSKIENAFLNSELEYHFENYRVEYQITVDDHKIARIVSTATTEIVLSPHVKDIVLKQESSISCGKIMQLELYINNTQITDSQHVNFTDTSSKINYPLKRHVHDKLIEFKKVSVYTQNLNEEPYINVRVSRYIRGAKIKSKLIEGYKVVFIPSTLNKLPQDHYQKIETNGWETWTLAHPKDLLLPGQNYTMVLIPSQVL